MTSPKDEAPTYVFSDTVITALWRELIRLACEEALIRRLRHDKAVSRHHFPKQYGHFGEEK